MNKYNTIDTPEKILWLDKILMDGDKPRYSILSYDTETNGLQLQKSTIVGFSLSFNKESGFYIPFLEWIPDPESEKMLTIRAIPGKKSPVKVKGQFQCIWTKEYFPEDVTPQQYNLPERLPWMVDLMKRWLTPVQFFMWNAPFDVTMTAVNTGINLKDNLLLDGSLLVHILDENFSVGLKENAEKYKDYLGINPHVHAAMEKKELVTSIQLNGGKSGEVWRADMAPLSKYACADTFFTHGICEAALAEFTERFGEEKLEWLFVDEVMPVCKEVVCDMKQRGVYTDVEHFQKLYSENAQSLHKLEDKIIEEIEKVGAFEQFTLAKNYKEEITNKAFFLKLLELEDVPVPKKYDKKTDTWKVSTAKTVVKKAYEDEPHWVLAYMLGDGELLYSDEKVDKIYKDLFYEKTGKRYHFNINSKMHLAWLFFEFMKLDDSEVPKTPTGRHQLTAEVIENLIVPHFSGIKTLLTYNKLLKIQSTYVKPAVELNVDGWLYMNMKQNGTTSGRFSCSGGYNLQTLPRVDDELELLESCEFCDSKNVEVISETECLAHRKCNDCGKVREGITRPSAIKAGFIAPPGYKIVNADYSSLEPRCFAFVSGEPAIKDVYYKGFDFYSQIYCEMFDEKGEYSPNPEDPNFLKKIAKPKRTMVKPITLGIPYGAEDYQVARLIGATKKVRNRDTGKVEEIVDIDEGKRVRSLYLSKFAKLKQYMDDQDLKAATFGYVESLVGRRRHFKVAKVINDVLGEYGLDYQHLRFAKNKGLTKPNATAEDSRSGLMVSFTAEALYEIIDRLNFTIKEETITNPEKGYWKLMKNLLKEDLNNAKNNPIQAMAGHITNKGMLESNRAVRAENLDAWVCLQVHDEITMYAREDHADRVAELLKENMENNKFTDLIDIPMIADPIICDNLKEAK